MNIYMNTEILMESFELGLQNFFQNFGKNLAKNDWRHA